MHATKPIPATPTHCRRCSAELPLLRRYGGLCGACIVTQPPARLEDPTRRKWVIIARRVVRHPNGETYTQLRIRCDCGNERRMSLAEWRSGRAKQCNRCRMREEYRLRRGADAW